MTDDLDDLDGLDGPDGDVRVALGSLLVGEPPTTWAIGDDVTRGRAAQRRRRTRAGAAAGLVAAAVLVLGVIGPLRPTPSSVQPAGPPTNSSVPRGLLEQVEKAIVDTSLARVDWSASTVRGSAAEGVTLELALVRATLAEIDGEWVALPLEEGRLESRVTMTFAPSTPGPGSVLGACTPTTCEPEGPGMSFEDSPTLGAHVDEASYALAGGPAPADTIVLDRAYRAGTLIEVVSQPYVRIAPGPTPSAESQAGLRRWILSASTIRSVLDGIGDPYAAGGALAVAPSPTPSGEPSAGSINPRVDAALATMGWKVEGASSQIVIADGRTEADYLLRASAEPARTAALVIVSYPARTPPGDMLARCTEVTCPGRAVGFTATGGFVEDGRFVGQASFAAQGSLILDRAYGTGSLVEIVVGPPAYASDSAVPVKPMPALTVEEARRLLDVIGNPSGMPQPSRSTTPTGNASGVPTAPTTDCTAQRTTLTPVFVDAATGEHAVAIVVTNPAGEPCRLAGRPEVRLVAGGTPLDLTYVASQNPYGIPFTEPDAPFALEPGAEATFVISKFRCDSGVTATATEAQVSFPGSGSPIAVPLAGFVGLEQCTIVADTGGRAEDPANNLYVTAFMSGGASQ